MNARWYEHLYIATARSGSRHALPLALSFSLSYADRSEFVIMYCLWYCATLAQFCCCCYRSPRLSFLSLRFALLRFDYTNKQIFQFMTQKILEIIPRRGRGKRWLVLKSGKITRRLFCYAKSYQNIVIQFFSVYSCKLKSEHALEREREKHYLWYHNKCWVREWI